MKKKIQAIIEEALLGAIIDKYTHRILNEPDIAKEATEEIMDLLDMKPKTMEEEKKIKKLAKYLKGTAKALDRLSVEIIARGKFDIEDEELLAKIGANLLFEAKIYTFRT